MPPESEQKDYSDRLAQINFNSTNISTEYQFEAWRQFTSLAFEAEPVGESSGYSFTCTSYLVDHLILSQSKFEAVQMIRPSQKLSGSESDFLSLQYYGGGKIQGSLGNGTPLLMQSDRVSLLDSAHSYRIFGQTDHVFSIIIPRHLVTDHDKIYTCAPTLSWMLNSPQGCLLLRAMQVIWQQLPHTTSADAPAISAGFIGLLNGLLSNRWNEVSRQQLQITTLHAMQHYIRANLHKPNLGVVHLCTTFHCSRATVYRLFQPLGGLMSYIREQRLTCCYDTIKRLRPTTQQRIHMIAEQWGFVNYARFSRLFKQRFGINPRDLRSLSWVQLDRERDNARDDLHAIERWQYWLMQTA